MLLAVIVAFLVVFSLRQRKGNEEGRLVPGNEGDLIEGKKL
jgi:hypothetical protein